MKKPIVVLMILVSIATAPLSAEWRVDLGLDLAFAGGSLACGEATVGGLGGMTLPIPLATGAWTFDAGSLTIGAGVRAVPLIVIVPFWPDLFAEVDLGPATLEAHLGGLVFGYFGVVSGIETGNVFLPEFSGWLKLGPRFRVGAGALGAWAPDASLFDDEGLSAWLFFGGFKWVLTPTT